MGLDKTEKVAQTAEIRYKGLINWGGLYHLIRKWFDDRKYVFMEPKYKDKVATPFGNEVEVKMKPYRKVTDFIKYRADIELKIWDFKEFEIERDGEKVLVTDGRMFIKITGYVDFDYTGRFKTPFEQKLLKILLSVFSKYYELKHIDNVTFSLYELQKEIKEFLNMETKYYGYEGFPG